MTEDQYTDWIAPLQSDAHEIYQSVFLKVFNSLLLKGVLVEDAKKKGIDFVEDAFNLRIGSFRPTHNIQDRDLFDSL